MVRGELSNQPYYILNDVKLSQQGDGDIKIVSPTQQNVEQAKMAVKKKIEEFPIHLPMKRRRPNKKSTKSSVKKKPRKHSTKKKSCVTKGGKAKKGVKSRKKSPVKSRISKRRDEKTIKGAKKQKHSQSKSRRSKKNIERKLEYF